MAKFAWKDQHQPNEGLVSSTYKELSGSGTVRDFADPYPKSNVSPKSDRQLIKGNPGPDAHKTTHRPPGSY